MEHIVQFGISIDDKFIADTIKERAEQQIIDRLYNDVKKVIFDYNRILDTNMPSEFVKVKIEEFLENNRDKIIEMTANCLAEKLARIKRGKEILNKYDKGKKG